MGTPVLCALVSVLCAVLFMRWKTDPLNRIPTIGSSLPLLSYIGAIRFIINGQTMLQEGYDKYKVFKVPTLDRWLVVVRGAQMNDELRKFPDDQMNFIDAVTETFHTKYAVAPDAVAPDVLVYPLHITAIREQLTRNLAVIFPGILEETEIGMQELIPATETEWLPIKAHHVIMQIISRASNRIFVGAPLCRNNEYLELCCNYATEVLKGSTLLTICPRFLRPVVGPLLPWSPRARRQILPYLKPLMDERKNQLDEEGGEWVDKPNDLLMWTMEEARREGLGHPEDLLVQWILSSNFAALHTSTLSFVHALYHLAASPEYIQPLREEVDTVVKEYGWTKLSMGHMIKVDSFLKESQRYNGVTSTAILRMALKDVTMSDGTYFPTGTIVTGATVCTHLDEENHENASVFDPFRYSKMREVEGEMAKHHYVTTSPIDIGFGHGKHACPGRFFAVNELKLILAYVVSHYDVKFEEEGKRPENVYIGTTILPDLKGQVLFRKRQIL